MKARINKSSKWFMRFLLLSAVTFLFCQNRIMAQTKIGDNPGTINAASVLELESTNKGFLMTRISDTTLINALNPPLGMLILVNNNLYIKGSSGWVQIQNVDQLSANYLKTSALTNGSVLFRGVNGISQDNANFKYDSTNKTLSIGGGITSSVTNASATYSAFSPGMLFPRVHMNIGNNSSDNNVGFVVAPTYSGAGVQKTAFWEVSTNKLAYDESDKDLLLMVTPTQSLIASYNNNQQAPYTYGGNPIYFQIQPAGTATPNTGLIMNNDVNNTITIGSGTANTTAQLNVIHRSSLAAAWFDNKIRIGANSGATGQLLFHGGTSGTLTIQPAAAAGNWTLTLPASTGSNGQVLQTDGTGVTSWGSVSSVIDTASMLNNYRNNISALLTDTATLISRFGEKLNLSDTSSMLTNYRNNISTLTNNVNALVSDTATLISRFGEKLNSADTSSMLTNYRNNISSLTNNVNALVSDTATLISRFGEKLNSADTSSMLTNYRNNISTLTNNVTALVSDTATLISRFGAKINYADTTAMLSNYRTNISSLITDTATLIPRFGAKVNYTDTTAMLSSYKANISSLIADTATLIPRFNAKVNVADTANMLSGYYRVTPVVSSVVSGAKVTYTAFNPLTGYPRGHMDIGNNANDVNVGFVVAPMYSSAGVQKTSFFEVSTNRLANDPGDKDLLMMVTTTQSLIGSYTNNQQSPYTAGNPIYFQIQPSGSYVPNNGLIINNDASNTVTIGSQTINTTAQLNVLHRNSLASAWFDNKIRIGANAGTTGQILLHGATSGTVTVQPADAAGTWSLTLPSTAGTNGQVLQTNGSGVTSWASVAPSNSAVTTTSASSYSILSSDTYVIYIGSSTATLTLPTAVGVSGKEYTIKNMSASTVTVNTTSSQLIWEDANTQNTSTNLGSTVQNNWIKVVSDGTRWIGFRSSF